MTSKQHTTLRRIERECDRRSIGCTHRVDEDGTVWITTEPNPAQVRRLRVMADGSIGTSYYVAAPSR